MDIWNSVKVLAGPLFGGVHLFQSGLNSAKSAQDAWSKTSCFRRLGEALYLMTGFGGQVTEGNDCNRKSNLMSINHK